MALLWPGVGEEDEDAVDRDRRQRPDQQPRIVDEQADIGEMPTLDLAEEFGDAVFEYLTADEANFAMPFGLGCEMLASAKADLQPNRPRRIGEHRARIELARRGQVDCEARQ